MSRQEAASVVLLIVLLTVANVLVYLQRRAPVPVSATRGAAWVEWEALPKVARLRLARQYEELLRQPGGGTDLYRAREFAALPAARQARLRAVAQLLDETIAAQAPARRGDWLRMKPRARAFMVFRSLETEAPQRLEALRASTVGRQ